MGGIRALIKMVEAGVLKLGMAGGVSAFGAFALQERDDALTTAEKGVVLVGAVFGPYG